MIFADVLDVLAQCSQRAIEIIGLFGMMSIDCRKNKHFFVSRQLQEKKRNRAPFQSLRAENWVQSIPPGPAGRRRAAAVNFVSADCDDCTFQGWDPFVY